MTNNNPAEELPYYEVWGRGGKPLLLLHGFMMSSEMFHPLMARLSQEYFVIAPDLRGFGKSKHLPGPYTIRQQAQDVSVLLNHLGIERTHLFGFSKGGLVAQTLALEQPERFVSLTLCCSFAYKALTPAERLQRLWLTSLFRNVGAEGLMRMLNAELSSRVTKLSTRIFHWYHKMLTDNRDDVLLLTTHELFKFDSRRQLGQIKMPTLIMGGSDDLIVPVHHAQFLMRSIPGARLKVFEGTGHSVLHTHPDAFLTSLTGFLSRVEPLNFTSIGFTDAPAV